MSILWCYTWHLLKTWKLNLQILEDNDASLSIATSSYYHQNFSLKMKKMGLSNTTPFHSTNCYCIITVYKVKRAVSSNTFVEQILISLHGRGRGVFSLDAADQPWWWENKECRIYALLSLFLIPSPSGGTQFATPIYKSQPWVSSGAWSKPAPHLPEQCQALKCGQQLHTEHEKLKLTLTGQG